MRVSTNAPTCLRAEAIDDSLAEWRERIRNATENLLALYDLTTMKRMEGRDGFDRVAFTGVTAARVTPALVSVQTIFEQLGTLTQTVDRAEALRKSLTRLRHYDETREEITRLLCGACVALPPDNTPLARRSLVSIAHQERAISLDRLLSEMTSAFETAKETVLAVDAAWLRLETKLDAALAKAASLQQRSEALGLPAQERLRTAVTEIGSLKARVLCDPLGISDEFERSIAPLLEAARLELDAATTERERFVADRERARRLQADLRTTSLACADAYAAAKSTISDVDGAELQPGCVDAATLTQLDDWLSTLDGAYRNAHWRPLQVGLQRYLETVNGLLEKERERAEKNRAALDAVPELKGRLAIIEARARHSFEGAAENSSVAAVTRLSAQAQILLEQNPIPLTQARKLVEACEARLRQKIT